MRVIAYTFEADVHCPACTREDASAGLLMRKPPLQIGVDEHGLAYDLIDREGNPIHTVFDIDEDIDGSFSYCGDCHEKL